MPDTDASESFSTELHKPLEQPKLTEQHHSAACAGRGFPTHKIEGRKIAGPKSSKERTPRLPCPEALRANAWQPPFRSTAKCLQPSEDMAA